MVQILKIVSLFAAAVSATQVTWDRAYGPGSSTLVRNTACSDGSNGLATKLGLGLDSNLEASLRPHLKAGVQYGGASEIISWNHPSCGKCFRAKYKTTGHQVIFVGLDVAPAGANVGVDAFNAISPTGNTDPGRLEVVIYPAAWTDCFNSPPKN
ncbi:hypothetical protein ABW21_db0205208 [Orbilia brochopaga]|nr:hypothetical protein ABW21_db0205208 [Drechslerella brochopaga]